MGIGDQNKCYVGAGAYSEPEGVGGNFTMIKNWSLTKATFMFYDPSHFLGKLAPPVHENLTTNYHFLSNEKMIMLTFCHRNIKILLIK